MNYYCREVDVRMLLFRVMEEEGESRRKRILQGFFEVVDEVSESRRSVRIFVVNYRREERGNDRS